MRLCGRAPDVDDLYLSFELGFHLSQSGLVNLSLDSVSESILLFYQWSEFRTEHLKPALDFRLNKRGCAPSCLDYFLIKGRIICGRINQLLEFSVEYELVYWVLEYLPPCDYGPPMALGTDWALYLIDVIVIDIFTAL